MGSQSLTTCQMVQVKELQPAVYFYCKNEGLDSQELVNITAPLLSGGGAIMRSDAMEMEYFDYLHHIIRFYDRLPEHILFSQAQPENMGLMLGRMQVMPQLDHQFN